LQVAKKSLADASSKVVPLASVAGPADIVMIDVPAGATLTVIVDVGPMTIPYTVQYAGRTIIKSLVDRAEDVLPLETGQRVLGWAFAHTEKGWLHTIGYSIDGGPEQILESRSEANKDPDHSVGAAIVQVAG
jgi:hypothetical protein